MRVACYDRTDPKQEQDSTTQTPDGGVADLDVGAPHALRQATRSCGGLRVFGSQDKGYTDGGLKTILIYSFQRSIPPSLLRFFKALCIKGFGLRVSGLRAFKSL